VNIEELKEKLPIKGVLRTSLRNDVWDNLKIKFPTDYRHFINYYGMGSVNGHIRIWSPFSGSWDNLV
jgi:hypothetical protein